MSSYQCVSKKFIGSKIRKSKKKHKAKHQNKHKPKKTKKKRDNIDTKSNLSIGSSVNKNNYVDFKTGNNLFLIYCLFKKVKKYHNFIPVTAPPRFFKSKFKEFFFLQELVINVPGKINYFECKKQDIVDWMIELRKRSEKFLVLDVLVKLNRFTKIPKGSQHANIIIFDTDKNEVYYIEPHGVNNYISDKQFKELEDFFQKISPGCKFYQHRDFLKFLPFQKTESKHKFINRSKISKDIGGYCFYWCFYLLNIILKFSHLPISVIMKQTYDSLMSFSVGKARITDFHRHIRSWGQRLEQGVIKTYPTLNSKYKYKITNTQAKKQFAELQKNFNL